MHSIATKNTIIVYSYDLIMMECSWVGPDGSTTDSELIKHNKNIAEMTVNLQVDIPTSIFIDACC